MPLKTTNMKLIVAVIYFTILTTAGSILAFDKDDFIPSDITFSETKSPFKHFQYPQEGTVVVENAEVYDSNLNKIHTLRERDSVTISEISERYLKHKSDRPYDNILFYKLKESGNLISTADVILEYHHNNPAYISPNKTIKMIVQPLNSLISMHWHDIKYKLWLISGDGNPIFLTTYHYTGCEPIEFVKFSPNEEFIFIEKTGEMFTSKGVLFGGGNTGLSSPTWDHDKVFFRGMGSDDRVYVLNLIEKKFKIFLDLKGDEYSDEPYCDAVWEPIEIISNTINTSFTRLMPPTEDHPTRCLTVKLTADINGKILSRKEDYCDDDTIGDSLIGY